MSNLKQVIIVCDDAKNNNKMITSIAKAPMLLVARVFAGGKNFMGRHEATEYQKIITEWIDDADLCTTIKTCSSIDARTYFWTTEMMGCPCHIVEADGETKCVAFGPYDGELLDDIVGHLPEYKPFTL